MPELFTAIGRIYNSEAKLFEARVRGATINIIVPPGQTAEKLLTNQAAFHSCIYLASGVYSQLPRP